MDQEVLYKCINMTKLVTQFICNNEPNPDLPLFIQRIYQNNSDPKYPSGVVKVIRGTTTSFFYVSWNCTVTKIPMFGMADGDEILY